MMDPSKINTYKAADLDALVLAGWVNPCNLTCNQYISVKDTNTITSALEHSYKIRLATMTTERIVSIYIDLKMEQKLVSFFEIAEDMKKIQG